MLTWHWQAARSLYVPGKENLPHEAQAGFYVHGSVQVPPLIAEASAQIWHTRLR